MVARLAPLLAIALLFGCAMNSSQPAAATAAHPSMTAATTQAATPAAPANPAFRNVKVLPQTLTRDQLIAVMRSFTRGLGVKCNECHVVTATEPREQLDFASDAKEEKRVARVMIQMTQQINTEWLERVEQAAGNGESEKPEDPTAMLLNPRVGCWTCHRGHKEPEMPPPPPAPPANAPPPPSH